MTDTTMLIAGAQADAKHWKERAETAEAEVAELQAVADNRLRELECLRAPFVEELPGDAEGYFVPEDGWVCFHCGIRFKTIRSARAHFGETPQAVARCVQNAQRDRT